MLWIKLKPDESIDVKDTDGNLLGVLTAHQRGGSVRIGFDGLKKLIFKRRGRERRGHAGQHSNMADAISLPNLPTGPRHD